MIKKNNMWRILHKHLGWLCKQTRQKLKHTLYTHSEKCKTYNFKPSMIMKQKYTARPIIIDYKFVLCQYHFNWDEFERKCLDQDIYR